jgi:hypothetical protein
MRGGGRGRERERMIDERGKAVANWEVSVLSEHLL